MDFSSPDGSDDVKVHNRSRACRDLPQGPLGEAVVYELKNDKWYKVDLKEVEGETILEIADKSLCFKWPSGIYACTDDATWFKLGDRENKLWLFDIIPSTTSGHSTLKESMLVYER